MPAKKQEIASKEMLTACELKLRIENATICDINF